MPVRTAVAALALTALTVAAAAGEPSSAPASLAERWGVKAGAAETVSVCAHPEALPSLFREALDRYAMCADDPAAARADILDRMVRSPMCYTASTPEEYDAIIRRTALLPAWMLTEPGERFGTTSPVWAGEGNANGTSGRAQPANLTFSFPADGALWGVDGDTAPNDMNLRLNAFFGVANRDRALELFRQVYAGFRRAGGLRYTEVADDNTPFNFGTNRTPLRGDIRVGSVVIGGGATGILAYNFFPDGGGDMTINSAYFLGSYSNSNNNYRFLRNVVAHEHGHGLAYAHVIPCNGQKLMEPFINTGFDAIQIDEMRGVQRNYGDRFAGNNEAGTATDFGSLTSPAVVSVIERDLSTNGTAGPLNTDEDWFRFTLGSNQNLVITVTPTGGSYLSTVNNNNGDCAGSPTTINAGAAGNLNVELRNSAGTTVVQSASSAAAGSAEVLTRNNTTAGTYTLRVVDVGPNSAVNQIVQTYNLSIRVGTSKAPPQAIAGVNKRIGAGFPCWFRGDLNSRANESGVTITNYQWDFENDGVFDATGAEVSTTYSTPGPRTARLRVTDSNGLTDDDTIVVDVFDATPPPPPSAPTLLDPPNGATVNVINPMLDWTDSTNVDFYTVVVDFSPTFNSPLFTVQALQSQIFTAPGTFQENQTYYWKVTAESSFGSTPALQPSFSFRINTAPPPACPGDLDGDNDRDTVDLVSFLGDFGTLVPPFTSSDFTGDGQVNTADLVFFLGRFGVPCP
ncbi:MAG: PKD domain-containing protein [Phycisphaerales bacterium]